MDYYTAWLMVQLMPEAVRGPVVAVIVVLCLAFWAWILWPRQRRNG